MENDQPPDKVERDYYGPLDDYLGRLIPDVIRIISNGSAPVFSGAYLEDVHRMAFDMAKRTPDFTDRPDDEDVGRDLVRHSQEEADSIEEHSKLTAIASDPQKLTQYGRDVRVRAALVKSPRVEEALKEFL